VSDVQIFDLAAALGAKSASLQKFSIYLPDRDKNNQPVPDIEDYVQVAMLMLLEINTGVTRLRSAFGKFKDLTTGIVSHENTHLVYSFLMDPAAFQSRLGEITTFLRDFGKNTNQASVLVEFAGAIPDDAGGLGQYFCRAYSIEDF
jgi:hypothetical protein